MRRGPSIPEAPSLPPGTRRRPKCARLCLRAHRRVSPPVGGEVRTAPRGGPDARRGGAVAMAREARPHTNGAVRGAAPLPPDCLLPLLPPATSKSPRPQLVSYTPLRGPEPVAWGLEVVGRPAGLQNPRLPGCPQRRPRPGWVEILGRCRAAQPRHRHQEGTAAESTGAALEMGVATLGGGK